MKKEPRVLMVGWDGATFDVIEPLVKQGRMPNIGRLIQNGTSGRMMSTVPPLTPVAWTSMSTGVNPGKHGIFDAMVLFPDEHQVHMVNATMKKVKSVWSLLSDSGKKVGVMHVPVTYPVDRVNGFFISGMFTPPQASDFMCPANLMEELDGHFGRHMIECRQDDNPAVYLANIMEEVEKNERTCLYLIEHKEWDFLFLVFTASDRVQHFFWRYLDPAHPEHAKFGDAIAKVYERMDEALGRLIEKAGPDVNIVMGSDHGAGPLKKAFFLNRWLIENGYLYLMDDPSIAWQKQLFPGFRGKLARCAAAMLPGRIWRMVKHHLMPGLQTKELNFFMSLIDWTRTAVFSEGVAGGIFVNRSVVSPSDYDSTLARISEGLLSLRDPAGNVVVNAVYRKDEVFKGAHSGTAPDLTVRCSRGYEIISQNEIFFLNQDTKTSLFCDHRWSGRHESDGIFVMHGPHVLSGLKLADASIMDVTPTLLYLMGQAIPENLDGKARTDGIEKSYLAENPAKYAASSALTNDSGGQILSTDGEREIADRLRDLGYL